MRTRLLSRRRFAALALGAAAALTIGAFSPAIDAQGGKPKIEIMVLHATQDPKGGHIDPQVAKMPQLTQPPFSAYNSYALLDKKLLPAELLKTADPWKGKPTVPYTLVNGRVLQVTVIDQLAAWIADTRWDALPATGGFARLRREGVYVKQVRYDHAVTTTAAGHAQLFTGAPPCQSGIFGNR